MPTNLIGTGSDQVSANGMLGELAFQNKDSLDVSGGKAALTSLTVKEINNIKNITAVDVFVYDTSKDSDGGAWRKRTQHTSWYNEELNTAVRGSRREFPSVAVIVVQSGYVTIYDGDDASLPMWMGFRDASYAGQLWEFNPFCTYALNGKVAVGSNGFDLNVVDFIADNAVSYSDNSNISGTHKFPISGRAPVTGTYSAPADVWTFGTVPNIINRYISDVTMTVLPNAPIDYATGLPIPTIAVATNGGVSVIKDDGTVVNKSGGVYLRVEAYGEYYIAKGSGDDLCVIRWNDTGTTISFVTGNFRYNGNPATGFFPFLYGNGGKVNIAGARSFAYAAGLTGVQVYNESGVTDRQTMCASVRNTHNTGWMPGDIKGAWLSDTTQETVVSTELITNGTFDSNTTTGWVNYNCTLSAASNQMTITRTGGTGLVAYQTINTQIGKTYVFSAKVNSSGSRGDVIIKDGADGGGTTIRNLVGTSGQTVTLQTQFVATTAQHTIMFAVDSNGTAIIVDDITCRFGESDRSVNAKGLQVFGNIVKTPVATGADLVGYSGWSGSNSLEQPYNSTMDFGTGNFAFIGWVKATVGGLVIGRDNASSVDGIRFTLFNGSTVRVTVTSVVDRDIAYSTLDGQWKCFVVSRSNSVISTFINGVQIDSFANTTNLSGTDKKILIGSNANSSTMMALMRVSATAPSPEQIRKMYEDEKVLFQDNAKATLFGFSDAVTALAYDDDTQLLHAGTSSGRSVFQGLRRIDNTTTPVARTISAANGLVAED